MGLGDLDALRADPPARPRRSGRRSSPSRAPARRASPVGVVDLQRRDGRGDAVDLGLPGADHQVVVGRVVGDVAGAVGLLDAADPVLEAGGARDRPRPGQRLGVAQVRARTPRLPSVERRGWARSRTRRAGPAGPRRPGPATARSRWPGSRRRAGSPGSGTSWRSGRPRARRRSSPRASAARRSAPAPRRCGRTSPAAGRPARSWSAGRWTGRRAARRRRSAAAPARPPSPIVSALSASPGPEVVVTASAPPNAAPSAAPTPAISSSAWKVRTPNRLCLLSSCRMSEAGVIGYEPRNSGSPDRCDAATRP